MGHPKDTRTPDCKVVEGSGQHPYTDSLRTVFYHGLTHRSRKVRKVTVTETSQDLQYTTTHLTDRVEVTTDFIEECVPGVPVNGVSGVTFSLKGADKFSTLIITIHSPLR